VIAVLFSQLTVVVGVRRACGLFGVSRAGHYRAGRPPVSGPRRPRPRPQNALTDAETAEVLAVLRAPEHCELAPAQVWARLLDAGVFLCSIATMYRILRTVDEVGERRRQRTHPAKKKPELMATKPCQVWSWDITKLRTSKRGVYFELYVIIDIYSRYVVGWTVAGHETGELAKAFIADTYKRHNIVKGQLALHADRGTSMTSKPVAQLLVDLGVDRSHSRPHVSNDNPYSEAAFKTLKYCPAFPDTFGSLQDARAFCTLFFDYYNDRHYHSGIAMLTPATVHYGHVETVQNARAATLDTAWAEHPERFARQPRPLKMPTSAWINDPSQEANIRNK
jgi:putative transposase